MFQITKSTLKISQYLATKEPGNFIEYSKIEKNTGVKMDDQGKGYLRTALKRLKLEYLSYKGFGIELANEETTITVINGRVRKIDNSVKGAERSHKILTTKHYDQLNESDRKRADFVGSVFAIIRAESKAMQKIMVSKEPQKLGNYMKPTPPKL